MHWALSALSGPLEKMTAWPGGTKYVLGVAADAGGTLCVGMPGDAEEDHDIP